MSFADKLSFGSFDGVPSRRRRLAGMSLGLVYLAFPITEVVSGEMRGIEAVWGIISILAYTAAYIATTLSPRDFHQSNRWTLPLMALTSIMAAAFALIFGGGWLTLPIYTVVLYAFILPPKRAVIGIAGMLVVVVACGIVDKADAGSIGVLGLQVVTMGVLFISVRNTRLLAHRLREAQGEVARLAATEERLRIARDLHDLLGHSLSLIVLKSELAGRMADDRPGVRGELADIESVARQALVEVREAVTGYRQRGLAEELDSARAVLRAAGVQPVVRVAGTPLPAPLDGLLGWAAREGVTNVVRHAGASRCEIDVTYDGTHATLEITDDGRGAVPYKGDGAGSGRRDAVSSGTRRNGVGGPGRGGATGDGPHGSAGGGAFGGGPHGFPADGPVSGGGGVGVGGSPGSGLCGLRERIEAAGGTMEAGPWRRGFRLRATV
ncbi:histidine kinase [Nonomuraea sp. NBC_01738]|uniref:sensor histidine kinase n=1 Tax=Nonomuraea sp. NBC_01738 TaxID=2976003 RepID=UPI002E121F9D|nr:histidine kinase [Nonomuraea sp. NBC_01738]